MRNRLFTAPSRFGYSSAYTAVVSNDRGIDGGAFGVEPPSDAESTQGSTGFLKYGKPEGMSQHTVIFQCDRDFVRGSGSGYDGRIRFAHFSRRSSQVSDDAAHFPGVEVAGRGERHSIASPDKQLGSQKSL